MPNSVEKIRRSGSSGGALVLFMGVNQMRTPDIAMIAAACGFDGVYIDLEHNPTSLETAAAICVAALGLAITPIARVSSRDPHDATRILDCGAQGVMVPHVSTVAEAKAVVESCRYPPLGHRSASGSGPALGYAARSQGEINAYLNEQTPRAMLGRRKRSRMPTRSQRWTASTSSTSGPQISARKWAFPVNTRMRACVRLMK
jgi:2-keto-3-deoxy-L-rhamnonate aldolase RhmA